MRAGVLQLSRWGVLEDVVAAGTPPIRGTTFHYADGESVDVSIRQRTGVDALYAPRRYLLDRILVDAAAAAGADVRHESTATALLRAGDGRACGVRTEDRSGRATVVRAALTVGADGIRSTVAGQAAAPVLRQGRSASAMLYRYYAGIDTTRYEWAYGTGVGAGLLPTNDGLTCVFVGTTPDRMRTLRRNAGEHAMRSLLTAAGTSLAERVASATPVGGIRGWAARPGFVRRCWGAGWALVGDAGYFRDPITTHGMTDALRDAEVLADAILDALSGVLPEAAALARYQATRDRLSNRLFDATEALASFDWDLAKIRSLLRDVSSAMSDEVDHLRVLPPRRGTAGRPAPDHLRR
jgi:flavin-dependent dehydrogenase